MAEEIILKENLKLGPSYDILYNTSLTIDYISYTSTKEDCKVYLKDVIGAKVKDDGKRLFLHIYTYPLVKHGFWSDKLKRHRKEVVFCIDNGQSLEENRAIGDSWVKNIRKIIYADTVQNNEPRNLKFVVFVNPFGGQGFAMKTFKNEVKVMLDEADVDYELKTTEYAGHAKEIAKSLDVTNVDCLLFCSGDGLIHEVVNGLMDRPDWKEAILTPLGHIPCGSGNGLCAAVLCKAKEPFDITSSVFVVLRGHVCPLDLVKAETCDGKVHYSFLGIVHGIVADIDIGSEKYRVVGDLRFLVMALIKITSKYCYKGEIWYMSEDNDIDGDDSNVDKSTKVDTCLVNGIYSEPTKTQKSSEVDTRSSDGQFYRDSKVQMVSDTKSGLGEDTKTQEHTTVDTTFSEGTKHSVVEMASDTKTNDGEFDTTVDTMVQNSTLDITKANDGELDTTVDTMVQNSTLDITKANDGEFDTTVDTMVQNSTLDITKASDGGFDTSNDGAYSSKIHLNGKLPTSSHPQQEVTSSEDCIDIPKTARHITNTSMNDIGCHSDISTGLANEILPSMSEPVPHNWKCIKGNFIGWVFTPLSHIGSNAHMVPEAKFGGGMLYCIYLMEDMSRRDLIEMIGALEKGDYFHLPGVNLIKSKAFRFDMVSAHSSIATIDGECVTYGPMQAEVFAGLARVRCL